MHAVWLWRHRGGTQQDTGSMLLTSQEKHFVVALLGTVVWESPGAIRKCATFLMLTDTTGL